MTAAPAPKSASCTQSIMAETVPEARPTSAGAKSFAATSQTTNPRAIVTILPRIRVMEFSAIGSDRPVEVGSLPAAVTAGRRGRKPRSIAVMFGTDGSRTRPSLLAMDGTRLPDGDHLPEATGEDAQHGDVVEDRIDEIVRDPIGLTLAQRQRDAPHGSSRGDTQQVGGAPAELEHHPGQTLAIGRELAAGTGEGVLEAVGDD